MRSQHFHSFMRKEEREVSLDYLMSERYFEPSAMDSYFEKQDKPTVFLVLGKGKGVAADTARKENRKRKNGQGGFMA